MFPFRSISLIFQNKLVHSDSCKNQGNSHIILTPPPPLPLTCNPLPLDISMVQSNVLPTAATQKNMMARRNQMSATQSNARHPHEQTITGHSCLPPRNQTMINRVIRPPTQTENGQNSLPLPLLRDQIITTPPTAGLKKRGEAITMPNNPSFTNNSYLYGQEGIIYN